MGQMELTGIDECFNLNSIFYYNLFMAKEV